MKFSTIKVLLLILICYIELLSCISYDCKDIVYKIFRYVNSVSGLCLRLRDNALDINLPFDMCGWLVEGEDVGVVHGVLVRHHQCLTSRLLLRL